MKNISKQFAVSATHSNQSEFKRATILLTAYYTLGVFILLIIFNVLVYGLFSNNIHEARVENEEIHLLGEDGGELGELDIEIIQSNLTKTLLISDLIILFLSLVVAYAVAKKTLAPIERAYKKQKMFVADAAHELRTPLSVMQAGSDVVLRSERTVDEYVKYIKEFLQETKRLTALSNDLLFLASNDTTNKKTSFSKVSLSDICIKQVEKINTYAGAKDVLVESFVDANIFVWGSGDDLTRLVMNVLKNAIDYNKKDGKVSVYLNQKGSEVLLKIKDTGIGIKKENLPLIFDRFYKADNARAQNSSGTGLGLAIVKEIVSEHQGTIKVSSAPEEGTVFDITMPSA